MKKVLANNLVVIMGLWAISTLLVGCVSKAVPTKSSPTEFPYRTPQSTPAPTHASTAVPTRVAPQTAVPSPTVIPAPPPIGQSDLAAPVWRCWDDGYADPCHRPLNAITLLSDTEGWIVGEAGAILHWNGQEWRAVDSPTTFSLRVVVAVTTQDAWASGFNRDNRSEGVLLHWDGETWSIFPNPMPLARIVSMSFVNETDGWAISQQTGTPYFITHLAHWDGNVWTKMVEVPPLFSLKMLSATDGWAIGGWGTIYHWDGRIWQVVGPFDADGPELGSMSFVSPNDGWATRGDRVIMRWNGIEWQVYSSNQVNPRHVLMTSTADGWMTGYDDRGGPILLRWDNHSWKLFEGTKPEGELQGLAATDSSNVWAVSNQGSRQIWHWDGSTWEAYESLPSHQTNAMAFVSETEAWLVGEEGFIARWDGQQLIPVKSPTSSALYDILFVAPDNGWSVGAGTQILHWNGYSWTVVRPYQPRKAGPSGAFASLTGIDFTSPTDGWAVGEVDTESGGFLFMLHWDGLHWERIPNPANYWLQSASILTSADVWAVGAQSGFPFDMGILLHWDGQRWKEAFRSPNGLNSIVMLSANEGWMVGDGGPTFHWNGAEWQSAASPVVHRIVDLEVSPNGNVWAITSTGTLLHPTTQ